MVKYTSINDTSTKTYLKIMHLKKWKLNNKSQTHLYLTIKPNKIKMIKNKRNKKILVFKKKYIIKLKNQKLIN
jgi:hypothetical protein